MRQQYHDAIVRARSKPDVIITMTYNPQWPEIAAELRPHDSPQDCTVTKVFKLKLDALINDLIENGVLGETLAHMYCMSLDFRRAACHILTFFLFYKIPISHGRPSMSIP
jgi:Helitron helicase-like domain at N-terminus